jgi:hypothetical protein
MAIFPMIGRGLNLATRKLATEIFVSSFATLLVMALFSNVMKATPPSSAPTEQAAAGSAKAADFMEQVALSHVAGLKPPSSPQSSAAVEAASSVTANPAAPAAPVPAVIAHRSEIAHAAAIHVAANVPYVLPPRRPSSVAVPVVLPVASAAIVPQKVKSHSVIDYGLRPLRFGMHLVGDAVDFVPASGARVVQGAASVGGAITSFVKKL